MPTYKTNGKKAKKLKRIKTFLLIQRFLSLEVGNKKCMFVHKRKRKLQFYKQFSLENGETNLKLPKEKLPLKCK